MRIILQNLDLRILAEKDTPFFPAGLQSLLGWKKIYLLDF
jgi:hypothetical protein